MELYPYQQEGVAFLKSRKKAFLFDDPGLGKTAQGLCALDPALPAMVFAPKAAKAVWFAECLRWRSDVVPRIINKRKDFRWPVPGELLILNLDLLQGNTTVGPPSGLQILVDEAHSLKNTKTQRSKLFTSVGHAASGVGGSVWFFTGTPILTSPADLWGLISNMGIIPETYGTWVSFKRKFKGSDWKLKPFVTITRFPVNPEPGALDPIRPYVLRRRKWEVLPQLPTKVYETYKVEASFQSTVKLTEEEIETGSAIGQPHVTTWRKDVSYAKQSMARDCIQELSESEPLVIFSCFRKTIEDLTEALRVSGILCGVITGDTSANDRASIAEDFQRGTIKILAGTIGAMGVSLTLTKASRVIFIDRDWTPALNKQAEDRVCRIGQTRGVVITDIVCDDPIDQLVTKVLVRKAKLIENTTEVM